jgi:hypothetical protein
VMKSRRLMRFPQFERLRRVHWSKEASSPRFASPYSITPGINLVY